MKYLMIPLFCLLLIGCQSKTQWSGTNITGLMPNLEFSLQGPNGAVTQQDLRGKAVLLFFGYTSCPDVCPATLMKLAQARASLPVALQKQIVILFVSVDPKRDTPAVLKKYTHFFGKGVLGVTGSRDQLDAITQRYRTSYSYGKPDKSGNYMVNHGSGIYGFDKRGRVHVLFMTQDTPVKGIATNMRKLIQVTPGLS